MHAASTSSRPASRHVRSRLLAAAAVLAAVLAGCAGQTDDGEPSDRVLRVAYCCTATSLDPALAPLNQFYYLSPEYDRLFSWNDDGTPAPMLATEWEYAADGSSLELTLRDDAVFHDGNPVDAEAVKYNLDRARTIDGGTSVGLLSNVTDVEVVDDLTVRLHLAPGTGAGLTQVLGGVTGMIASPAVLETVPDLSLDPGDAGSGPFRVTAFEPGQSASYERMPEHWDDTVSDFSGIQIDYVADVTQRMNAIQGGTYDLAVVTGEQVVQARQRIDAGDFAGEFIQQAQPHTLLMHPEGELADQRVRQAIEQAIDKDSISQGLYAGTCTVNDFYYQEGDWIYSDDLEDPYPYDPDAAVELLADAGYGPGDLHLTLNTGSNSSFQPVAEAIQAQLTDVGIDAQVSLAPFAEAQATFAAGDTNAFVGVVFASADPSAFFTNYFLSPTGFALAGDEGASFDFVTAADDPTLDDDERATIYREGLQQAVDDVYSVPVCNAAQGWIYPDDLVGFGELFGWNSANGDFARNFRYES